jgi:hypothetical protein
MRKHINLSKVVQVLILNRIRALMLVLQII